LKVQGLLFVGCNETMRIITLFQEKGCGEFLCGKIKRSFCLKVAITTPIENLGVFPKVQEFRIDCYF